MPEKVTGQFRIVFQRKKRNSQRNLVDQLVQSRNAIVRQFLADHGRGKRPHFHHVIFEAERPRLACDGAQDNRRIREAVIFPKENELRLG